MGNVELERKHAPLALRGSRPGVAGARLRAHGWDRRGCRSISPESTKWVELR